MKGVQRVQKLLVGGRRAAQRPPCLERPTLLLERPPLSVHPPVCPPSQGAHTLHLRPPLTGAGIRRAVLLGHGPPAVHRPRHAGPRVSAAGMLTHLGSGGFCMQAL